ncbi:hypothetical protein PIB30_068589 [Stylosanthes scabra]|uniref:Uncharacterized protein n=1 Tax=Stylosanthes scabra TaxID=79078 RepID=A0ABU6SNH2_9FABA|nr:hypothetical protein [Stylosanthes scabra]
MARNGPSPLAKRKGKGYGPPTRESPWLAALRARLAANSYPETPVTPVALAPTARRTARIFVKYYSMRLANKGGPSNVTPTNYDPIEIGSDFETESQLEDTDNELVTMEREQEQEQGEEEGEITRKSKRRTLRKNRREFRRGVSMKATLDLLQQTSRRMIAPQ